MVDFIMLKLKNKGGYRNYKFLVNIQYKTILSLLSWDPGVSYVLQNVKNF